MTPRQQREQPQGRVTTHKTACKICGAACAVEMDVVDGSIVAVRGDRDDPLFGGYTCLKGRAGWEAYTHPDRLIQAQRRGKGGNFVSVGTDEALNTTAERLREIIDRHGPGTIALYCGTYGFLNSALVVLAPAFQAALGSHHYYTPLTIDQPAKFLCAPRMGEWEGGWQSAEGADVVLLFGNNVLISHYAAPAGISGVSPSRALRQAQERGCKVVVVDPRRSETARRADRHVQIRPGRDATYIAGLIRLILKEGLQDQAFCDRYVSGLDTLRSAVEPFTLNYVSDHAGVSVEDITATARLFGKARRGAASSGTGPEMAPDGLVTEYLITALNIICGRVTRVGDAPSRQPVIFPTGPATARVRQPSEPLDEATPRSRFRGLTSLGGQMPVSVLADEILTPGPDKVRALIVLGGNPVTAFPDQDKIAKALTALDFLVVADRRLSQTARHADIVFAGSMAAERDDISLLNELFSAFNGKPYGFYMPAVVPPPPGTIDETELLRALAGRLGLEVPLPGGILPLDGPLTKFDLLSLVAAGGPISVEELREVTQTGGKIFAHLTTCVQPARDDDSARFTLDQTDLIARLANISKSQAMAPDGYDCLCVSRRLSHRLNSFGLEINAMRKHDPVATAAFIHPNDMQVMKLSDGDAVEISSVWSGQMLAIVRPDETIRRGVIAVSHGVGDVDAGLDKLRTFGSSSNRLVNDVDVDPITGMPIQSAIPVRIRRVPPEGKDG